MPYYKQFGWKKGDFPLAESYYDKCLSLPMYPALSNEQQDYVIENIIKFIGQ
jgi:dTDP-4-amino-4,6-dideoxygalactose transaminase